MRYRSCLRIHLPTLANNIELLQGLQKKILFMVKADAYGHGLIPIVRFAHFESQIHDFGCASLKEAVELRCALPDGKFEIYVFSDLNMHDSGFHQYYAQKRILPVISNLEDLDIFLSSSDFKHVPLCLKFNTGMYRLGIDLEDLDQAIARIKKSQRNVHHLMSHFACSSLKINSFTQRQYERFSDLKKRFKTEGIEVEFTSMANSGAIEQNFAFQDETHIRPGLMLYGPSSMIKKDRKLSQWKGECVSSLETPIIGLRKVRKGDPIGYGAFACPEEGLLAYAALGYGDGISTHASGISVESQGKRGQIIGRVSMDMTALLFSSKSKINLGEIFYFWQRQNEQIYQLAEDMGTIPYELFCQISIRVPRVYDERV